MYESAGVITVISATNSLAVCHLQLIRSVCVASLQVPQKVLILLLVSTRPHG